MFHGASPQESAMTAAEEWARDFFTGTFVELWLQATPQGQTRQEADFLEKVFGLPAGASLLDVPCGGGRHWRSGSKPS